ncbi:hypothetical protein DPEC_G00316720 [Dallia pectoralis]|uniref:Uncharacterized protein n=1 Tax=Dallia pectoralis TaxID=75939 RepID=A0ACC2FCS3_DALPE|nr:hypothetical protein DPEC_G00316720 [Dallia pectoralis]
MTRLWPTQTADTTTAPRPPCQEATTAVEHDNESDASVPTVRLAWASGRRGLRRLWGGPAPRQQMRVLMSEAASGPAERRPLLIPH